MKITVEAVPTINTARGMSWIKNKVFLNGNFEGILGHFGRLEFETDRVDNELLIIGLKKETIIKFSTEEDSSFWIVDEPTVIGIGKTNPEIYYKGRNLKIIEIR